MISSPIMKRERQGKFSRSIAGRRSEASDFPELSTVKVQLKSMHRSLLGRCAPARPAQRKSRKRMSNAISATPAPK